MTSAVEDEEDYESIAVLEFTTEEVEPPKARPIKVPLGGKEYIARCPNDYEFMIIYRQLQDMNDQKIYELDVLKLISGFFSAEDAREIDLKSRGEKAVIPFQNLFNALGALVDHYFPFIGERAKHANRATRRAKKVPARR
jgi:hypothetical protein